MNFRKSVLLLLVSVLAFLFVGCAKTNSSVSEFNKPAIYWYKNIAKSIGSGNLDKADAYYISLKSEHLHSPFVKTAIMMLANAHMNKEEYILAKFYLDEYNKRFGDYSSLKYTDFIKLQASFLGIKDVYKDQKLIMDTIGACNSYIYSYPDSVYTPLVDNMLARLYMSKYLLNENIASLYERTGHKKAAKIYRDKNKKSIVEMTDITAPKQSVIGKVFD